MPKRRFTEALLTEQLRQDGAIRTGKYDKITRDTPITFICKCGSESKKIMRAIIDNAGALCKSCSMTHMVETQQNTMIEIYGESNPMLVPEFKKKMEDTMMATYGVSHNSLNPDTVQRRKDTLFENWGVPHHFQLPEKIQERRQNCLDKFGVPHHLQRDDILAKQRATNMERRGVEYALQSEDCKAKAIVTNLAVYGVEHPSQNKEVMERTQKSAKKYKDYVMPSGAVRKVQGYEPFALKELEQSGYSEDQIKTDRDEVPTIEYEVDGKKKYHFPDIFIPHENKIVEVKSTWTLKCKTDNVQLKKAAAEQQGFHYEIWCFNGKGERVTPAPAAPPDTP